MLSYLKDVMLELNKVSWIKKNELLSLLGLSLMTVLICGMILSIIDFTASVLLLRLLTL